MKLRFEADQTYQLEAIESVAGVLDGQPRAAVDISFSGSGGLASVPNRLDLGEGRLLENLRTVQLRNGLKPDAALACIEESTETGEGRKPVRFPNFSVEMETGTGKTYVYLRTMLELHRRYGLRKFVVVVPSVAVREGVLKTLDVTGPHFAQLYDGLPYRYYAYDSANLSQVRQFALSDSVEIMVMTIDSFNKATNIINQSTDRLQGDTPVHLVQSARPVLILDEPQNMESERRVRALSALDPLLALRYSATHRNPYNLVYRLTPFDAYRRELVKRIEVASVVKEGDNTGGAFVRLEEIKAQKTSLVARITAHKLTANGTLRESTFSLEPDDSLEKRTRRREYAGFEVDEISAGGGYVRFANGVELVAGEASGADRETIFEAQIRYTIEEHLRKQRRLKADGVKVLSLFFIDRVSNYAPEDGIIRVLFAKTFDDLKEKYPEWREKSAGEVQAAYFANSRKRSGEVVYEDSRSGAAQKDVRAYELIMRNKERLLSFDEPVAFIFSHSALREGWDNPNICQICTLNQAASAMRKRQEVGRGVRLVVNQSGERVRDERANILTVVANESYERYVAQLQSEVEMEYGKDALPPKPPRAGRKTAKLHKARLTTPEFQELWKRIGCRTRYSVSLDAGKLIADVVEELNKLDIKAPGIAVSRARVDVGNGDSPEFEALGMNVGRVVATLGGRPLPNLVEIMSALMESSSPSMRLTRRTLLEIYRRTDRKRAALENPHEFAAAAVQIIKSKMADQLVDRIRYEKTDDHYGVSRFQEFVEGWEEAMLPAGRSLYDYVICGSEIERRFAEQLERLDSVKLYIKLPRWFTIPTPAGEYSPDWALLIEGRNGHGEPANGSRTCMIVETKGSKGLDKLRPDERRKILCGKRHFEGALTGVEFRLATVPEDLFV